MGYAGRGADGRGPEVNLRAKVIDGLFLVAFGAFDPTDDEWVRYLALVESHGIDRTRQLIYTDGGGPSAKQRQALTALLAGRVVPTAVVSDRLSVRASVAVLAWINSSVHAYPLSGLADALDFLEVPLSRYALITGALRALQAEIGATQGE
jgi:hypothetical protein